MGRGTSLFVAASCDVGLFGDPKTRRAWGEDGDDARGRGDRRIPSTQLAFSTSNARLNGLIYDQIFEPRRGSGGQYHSGLAEALLSRKEIGRGRQPDPTT